MIIIVISYFSPFKKSEIAPPNPIPKKQKWIFQNLFHQTQKQKSFLEYKGLPNTNTNSLKLVTYSKDFMIESSNLISGLL